MSIAFPPPPLPPNPVLPSAGTTPRGYQGPVGAQGYQGAQGVQGPQGQQGNQGPQGFQGPQGSQGFQGPQGFQGNDGPQGRQGNQGILGMYGGYSVEYNYTAVSATNSDPGSGNLKLNGTDWGSTTAIYVSNIDAYVANVSAWLATLGASTNTIKGVIRFYKNGSSTVNTSYNITAATANSGYYALTVSNVIAAGTITI